MRVEWIRELADLQVGFLIQLAQQKIFCMQVYSLALNCVLSSTVWRETFG